MKTCSCCWWSAAAPGSRYSHDSEIQFTLNSNPNPKPRQPKYLQNPACSPAAFHIFISGFEIKSGSVAVACRRSSDSHLTHWWWHHRVKSIFYVQTVIKTESSWSVWLIDRWNRCVLLQVDGKHQDAGVQFERLRVDIQHLDLSKTGTSGHCGALTSPDLFLWRFQVKSLCSARRNCLWSELVNTCVERRQVRTAKKLSALIGGKQHPAYNSAVTAALRWFLQAPSCSLMAVHLHLCWSMMGLVLPGRAKPGAQFMFFSELQLKYTNIHLETSISVVLV